MIDWSEFQEQLAVKRRAVIAQTGERGALSTVLTVSADLQAPDGRTFYDAAGAVQIVDALALFEPVSGVLPDVRVDDVVERSSNGDRFTVVHVEQWTSPIAYLEVRLRRGGIHVHQPR